MKGFTVEVVKVKGPVNWAVKAVVDGIARYRGCYYKNEAILDLAEWENYHRNLLMIDIFRTREYLHNFNTAEELGIKEV